MNYSSKIHESKEKVYRHAIATKILDMMEKLRLSANEYSERRWIWELIQNAKDVRVDSSTISIRIDFQLNDNSNFLEFRHNGKPFTVDNITFLIEQVSTKDRDNQEGEKPKTTGKFGTGFLSTHLLSEKVEIEGIIKEPDLPYRTFNLVLDRSGKGISEIIQSVEESLVLLEKLDSQSSIIDYQESEFNTKFRYKLDNKGINVAQNGFLDLYTSLPFTLSFLPELQSVEILNKNLKYENLSSKAPVSNSVRICEIKKTEGLVSKNILIASITKGLTSIAIEIEYVNDKIKIKLIDEKTPKLFCDFPLIGSEIFHFPVIINNPTFNPTEPRNGVYLTDVEDDRIIENKDIINEAIELYFLLLDYAINNDWQNLEILSQIKIPKETEWLSRKWYESEVLMPIRSRLLHYPIVINTNGIKQPILNDLDEANIYFPYHSRKELRDTIWELAYKLYPNNLPRKGDIHKWYDIIWSDCYKLTIEELIKIVDNAETVSNLSEQLGSDVNSCISWLNQLYQLINEDENALNFINQDKYSIIPNQNDTFCKKSNLVIDRSIEETLKDVSLILGNDIRDKLINLFVRTGANIRYGSMLQDKLIDEINGIIAEGKNDQISKACDYLVSCLSDDANFPNKRQIIFDFCLKIWPDDFQEKRHIKSWSDSIWKEVDKCELKWIVQVIANEKTLENLTSKYLFATTQEATKWLNDFISFLVNADFENYINLSKSPILPDQNGVFRAKDDLFLDDGNIDETLKDISNDLGYDFRNELLCEDIFLGLPENRVKNIEMVADEINSLVRPKLNEYPRSEETKEIFKKIYLWFNKHKSLAENIFPDLYKSKHRLYDDEEIASNMEKAEQLNELLKEFNIVSVQDLRNIISKSDSSIADSEKINITKEILVSLGVSSQTELEKALENKDIAANFTHTTTPTVEMFVYAQSLISRAKLNIINYLKEQPQYDCTYYEEVATSIYGGIKKHGQDIYIVTRPSDNGEVLIYYGSEKETLYLDNAELWIDNGTDKPQILTLGKIIISTGINRIPII